MNSEGERRFLLIYSWNENAPFAVDAYGEVSESEAEQIEKNHLDTRKCDYIDAIKMTKPQYEQLIEELTKQGTKVTNHVKDS